MCKCVIQICIHILPAEQEIEKNCMFCLYKNVFFLRDIKRNIEYCFSGFMRTLPCSLAHSVNVPCIVDTVNCKYRKLII